MTGRELIEKLQGLDEATLELEVGMRESTDVYLEGVFEVDLITEWSLPQSQWPEVLFIS